MTQEEYYRIKAQIGIIDSALNDISAIIGNIDPTLLSNTNNAQPMSTTTSPVVSSAATAVQKTLNTPVLVGPIADAVKALEDEQKQEAAAANNTLDIYPRQAPYIVTLVNVQEVANNEYVAEVFDQYYGMKGFLSVSEHVYNDFCADQDAQPSDKSKYKIEWEYTMNENDLAAVSWVSI